MSLWIPELASHGPHERIDVHALEIVFLGVLEHGSVQVLIRPSEGEPYLAKTSALRRRLGRLLKRRDKPSRLLNLRDTVARVECWITGSALESSLRYYQLARLHFPKTYLELTRLRFPPYVKIILDNPFPRSQVTTVRPPESKLETVAWPRGSVTVTTLCMESYA